MSKAKGKSPAGAVDLGRGSIRVKLTGVAPLLMHDCSKLANPLHPITKAMKEITNKGSKQKTDEDHGELSRLEFVGGLYHKDAVGPYIPGVNIESCLREAARITRQGKAVERGIMVEEGECPLIYSGPRSVEKLWADLDHIDLRCVGLQSRSKVFRTRPIFKEWAVEATILYMGDVLDLAALRCILDRAGELVGLGDYRPKFGKFTWEMLEQASAAA